MENKLVSFLVAVLSIFVACSDDENAEGDPTQPLVFKSLIAEHDTINAGELTEIIATAEGYKISFHWSATGGDILGSGEQVTFTASPCYIGRNQVTCMVSDGNGQSETKKVIIIVQ